MLMKKIMSLVVATVLILGLTGSVLAEQETYRVGMLLPLTGPSASGGQDAKKGVEMAVDYINADGGIKGKKLEMIYCDANDADSGIAETTRLIEVEKVQLVAWHIRKCRKFCRINYCRTAENCILRNGVSFS